MLNWEEIKKYMWAGTKKLTKFHLEYFQKTDEYIKCSLKSAELKTAWTEVMTAFEAASFSDFDEKRRGKVETELTQRFGKDIDYMFTGYWTPPANPAYPKL